MPPSEIPVPAQVISGGHYDVDCFVEDPNGKTIYQETKKQYDSFSHHTELKGVYTFCFGNEFSTFSHKIVYFDFQVGDEPPILPNMNNRVTALTQVGPGGKGGREGGSCCSPQAALQGGSWGLVPILLCWMQKCQPPATSPTTANTNHILCLARGGCAGSGLPCLHSPCPSHTRELHQPFHPLLWASGLGIRGP